MFLSHWLKSLLLIAQPWVSSRLVLRCRIPARPGSVPAAWWSRWTRRCPSRSTAAAPGRLCSSSAAGRKRRRRRVREKEGGGTAPSSLSTFWTSELEQEDAASVCHSEVTEQISGSRTYRGRCGKVGFQCLMVWKYHIKRRKSSKKLL